MGIDLYLFKVAAYVHYEEEDSNLIGKVSLNGVAHRRGSRASVALWDQDQQQQERYSAAAAARKSAVKSFGDAAPMANGGATKFLDAPPLTDIVDQLRDEMDLPEDLSMAKAISQACAQLELAVDGFSMMGKAYAAWRVISGDGRNARISNSALVDLSAIPAVRLPIPSSTAPAAVAPAAVTPAAVAPPAPTSETPTSAAANGRGSPSPRSFSSSQGASPTSVAKASRDTSKSMGGLFGFSGGKSPPASKRALEVTLQ